MSQTYVNNFFGPMPGYAEGFATGFGVQGAAASPYGMAGGFGFPAAPYMPGMAGGFYGHAAQGMGQMFGPYGRGFGGGYGTGYGAGFGGGYGYSNGYGASPYGGFSAGSPWGRAYGGHGYGHGHGFGASPSFGGADHRYERGERYGHDDHGPYPQERFTGDGSWERKGYAVGESGKVNVNFKEANSANNNEVQYRVGGGDWVSAGKSKDMIGKNLQISAPPGSTVQFRIKTPDGVTRQAGSRRNDNGEDGAQISRTAGGATRLGFEDWTDKDYNDTVIELSDGRR